MKQILLFVALVFSAAGILSAQSLVINPNPALANFENVTLNSDTDLASHVTVKNKTSETLQLKWVREIPESCPNSWKTQVCDNNFCFDTIVSSNYVPGTAIEVPFVLQPNESYDDFILHVLPGTTPGCCPVTIKFSTIDDPDSILATLLFDVRVNDPNCLLSSTYEPSVLEALQVFPNPSTGFFSVTDNPLVKKIVVFDVFGRLVQSAEHTNGKTYDITDAPDGLYLISLQDANGEVIKTVRMTKQASRP